MKKILTTKCWGQRYSVRADWAQASCPVEVQYEDESWSGDPRGRQVADFRHRPEAALRDWIIEGQGEIENPQEVDDAIRKATQAD